jgi:hypothetical protein
MKMNLRFRFFDQEVRLFSDSAEYFTNFTELYRRFLIDESRSTHPVTINIAVLTTVHNAWHKPVLVIDSDVWPLADPHAMRASVYEYIFYAILARIRSHILIHGAALAYQDRAILICGDSQHGKTTIALKLLQHNLKFLSDEIAALGRRDGLVHPFPRSLRIRYGSLAKAGYDEMGSVGRFWLDKSLVDVEQLRPGALGESAPLTHIILLSDPDGHPAQAKEDAEQGLTITLSDANEPLLSAIRRLEFVRWVDVEHSPPYPTLFITTEQRAQVLYQVERLCRELRELQVLVLGVQKRGLYQPSFARQVRLEEVTHSQAVLELLGQFQGSHNSLILLEEYGGTSLKLYLEVAELIKHVHCHRLYVGPIEQMAELVCNLVKDRDGSAVADSL